MASVQGMEREREREGIQRKGKNRRVGALKGENDQMRSEKKTKWGKKGKRERQEKRLSKANHTEAIHYSQADGTKL